MSEKVQLILIGLFLLLFSACGDSIGGSGHDVNATTNGNQVLEEIIFSETKNKIPTLVVIMNWTNYSETNPLIWHNKIFNKEDNSVNRWYYDSTDANIELVPVSENSGTANDGIIIVNMNKLHPGGSNDTSFRDTEIRGAITSQSVANSVDFNALDLNNDGTLSRSELQIIFIVAGGEESYGDSVSHSVWAHSWSFESDSAPSVDGVTLMKTTSDVSTSGNYSKFGAIHDIDGRDPHKATIGIIAHELGHSLFDLMDMYNPTSGHSGLGYYDIMSGGSWGKKNIDTHEGETPTQFAAFSKIDTGIDTNVTVVSSSKNITIKCSSNEYVKLTTAKASEYFLLECRDSARVDSDRTFNHLDSSFTDNRLFAFIYHIDEDKEWNSEYGPQTAANHYKVALVERDIRDALTSTDNIKAEFSDAYTDGYIIDSTKTKTYSGAAGYNITVGTSDYTDRTMTFNITK